MTQINEKDKLGKLIEGHKRFHRDIFPGKRQQFHLLAEMQAPEWLFITCSDSRIVPDLILQTGPGDLFLSRSIGNVVPVSGNDVDGVTATIEYAVEVLKVKHIILCGHSDCGALKAALNRKGLEKLPKASRWLHHVEGAFTHRQPLNPADGEHAELASIIRGNVVAQLINLRAQPSVDRALVNGQIEVHGWYYDILTGQIEQYDEQQRKFLPLLA
ncbi:carbonic anhydrase [Acidicapsa acidisoli]|uniref:carbonic anhydrase n=1 Tax=Acidicapsa acidisoli TaxID=1615681 RepID=UPI0021E01448|nr:carbonic anhydrase [Acidicapsa acidisoli]